MFSLVFWKATLERSVSTGAQTLLALAGTDALGWLALEWGQIGSASGIAAALSVVKSLALTSATGSPAVGSQEQLTDTPKHRAVS